MKFWSYNIAAPKFWQTFGFTNMDFLRKTPPPPPLISDYGQYRRLIIEDMDLVSNFLRENYGDSDWYLDAGPWLQTYFNDMRVIILGLFTKDNTLIATIFSTPLTNSVTYIGNKPYRNVRVIEGLCVHRNNRKMGIAGYMIAAIDYETSKEEPTVILYSRELSSTPIMSTHLNSKTYGYIDCSLARRTTDVLQMDKQEFNDLWVSNKFNWSPDNLIASLPTYRRDDIYIWSSSKSIIVVTDTKRRTKIGDRIIWETVWCGKFNPQTRLLYPSAVSLSDLESVASQHAGLFLWS